MTPMAAAGHVGGDEASHMAVAQERPQRAGEVLLRKRLHRPDASGRDR